MAAVGSAVGLGNIWGFSYKMGMSGGFGFLIIYVLLATFIGIAVMLGEFAIGRKTGQSPVGAYKALAKKFAWVGYLSVIAGFTILCFYLVLGGIVTRYCVGYFTALFGWDTWGASAADFYGIFRVDGMTMTIYFLIFSVINAFVVVAGVGEGIEKFCKVGMPALFIMLVIIVIYVAVQPGAGEGYKYMFAWNLEPLKADFFKVLKLAAGQMFFSLSLGMGVMITYGSYLDKKQDLQKNAVIVTICDTSVALLAGMIILPATAAFNNGQYAGGPGLLFNSMQIVFDNMGGFIGNLMGFLFYFLVFIAALSSSISILEGLTAYHVDKNIAEGKAPGRKKIATILSIAIFILGLTVALDGIGMGTANGAAFPTPAELLGVQPDANGAIPVWSDCWLDFFDMISEGILMPLGALIMCILIGYVWKVDLVVNECEVCGKKFWGHAFFTLCYKFITPIGMLFVLYAQISDFF